MSGIHRWPVNSPHKGLVTRKMFPLDDVIIKIECIFLALYLLMTWRQGRAATDTDCQRLAPKHWDYYTVIPRWLLNCQWRWEAWPAIGVIACSISWFIYKSLQWRLNERDCVSNHQPHDCLLNRLFKAQIKENINASRHWPLCGEFTGTGEFPAQKASNVENISIWWRHHGIFWELANQLTGCLCWLLFKLEQMLCKSYHVINAACGTIYWLCVYRVRLLYIALIEMIFAASLIRSEIRTIQCHHHTKTSIFFCTYTAVV